MNLRQIILLSRPRFWLYMAGPFAIGSILSPSLPSTFSQIFWVIYMFIFFLIPANIITYGINDLFDFDTDALNPKKNSKENRLMLSQKKYTAILIAICIIVSLPILMVLDAKPAWIMGLWLFLSLGYSMPPLRFKSKPFLDSLSNIFYIIPGFIAYFFQGGKDIPVIAIFALCSWPIAMHLFSAIPDIQFDKSAKIRTTAVLLNTKISLLLCSVLWMFFSVQIYCISHAFIFLFIYPIIPLILSRFPQEIENVYWKFPLINTIIGFVSFIAIALQRQ